jgi:MOSC domain-containing protein YiiM
VTNGESVPTGSSYAEAGGRVYRIGRKSETARERGLPKPAVEEAYVTLEGLEGDFNRYRHEEKADDPAMALLLLPQETIRALDGEGWPVRAGDLGENITSIGIPYAAFRPGRRFRIGRSTVVEISKACTPCDNLYLLPYVGRDRGPEFLRTMVDRRGWFARVREPGAIRRGDAIQPLA